MAKTQSQTAEEEVTLIRGSGNIYADLGFENPEEELAKAKLVSALAATISAQGLSQKIVGEKLGLTSSALSALLRGRTGAFTSDRLMQFLLLLGQDVEISVHPKRSDEARLSIALAG